MAKSTITLTFNSLPSVNDILEFSNDKQAQNILEVFKTLKTKSGETTLGSDIESCIIEYDNALNNDYNFGLNGNIYTLSFNISLSTLTIEAVQDNVVFAEVTNTTSGAVTAVIDNQTVAPTLTIDNITFSQSTNTNYCKMIKVNVDTNLLATSVSSPVVINPNADNPFSFDYARGGDITITCTDGITVATQSVTLPDVLRSSNISVSIFNTPNGGNATINLSAKYGLTLSYQVEDSVGNLSGWQSSNVFSSLTNGVYTVYVKDTFGCTAELGFVVSVFSPDISVTEAYSYVAKEMSIRYKKNEVWDYNSIYKTDDNTLSCEEDVENPYKHVHLFQTQDQITTQFLSNYETLEANVINEDGSKDAQTIVKRSTNIGATDKRDATYYSIDDTTTGIYFTSGDKYNYYTGIQNDTYELNGALPNYGYINNYIYLDGLGWFQIVDIIYNDTYDADVLVINYAYVGIPAEIIVSSIYNRENYDVYEFNIDMSAYEDKNIQVELLMSDNTFGESNYLSEVINVKERQGQTIEIIWYNPTDTFVFYSTGLKNKARIPYQLFTSGDDSELQIHKTARTVMMINSNSYETKDLELYPITNAIKQQLTKAFLHKELYLDRVKYVSNSAPETEPINFTNLYEFKANVQKTGIVFNSEWDGVGNSIEGVELIGILQSDNAYIKLQ